MADNNEFEVKNEGSGSSIHLTLDPNETGTAFATAVQEAVGDAVEATEAVYTDDVSGERLDIESLTPEEQAAVREFAEKIDVLNTEQVLNYGAAAQKNIAEFSESALQSVKTKDLGEVGGILSDLVVELEGFNFDEKDKKGIFGKKAV